MGYYIQAPGNHQKADYFCKEHGAKRVTLPEFDPTGKTVNVCVLHNGFFEAAGIAFDETEQEAFLRPCGRMKEWLVMDREKVIALCPEVEKYLPPLEADGGSLSITSTPEGA